MLIAPGGHFQTIKIAEPFAHPKILLLWRSLDVSFWAVALHHALKGRELHCLAASPVGSVLHIPDWR